MFGPCAGPLGGLEQADAHNVLIGTCLVGDVEEVGLRHYRSRSATRRMPASRRRPDARRAAPRTLKPASTRPTASAGENGLPVLASAVSPAAFVDGLTKFSPRTCVGTVVLVSAPPVTAVLVVVPATVVVVVPPAVVVVVPTVVVVVSGGQSCTQMTLCLSPPGRCTVMKMWKPCW